MNRNWVAKIALSPRMRNSMGCWRQYPRKGHEHTLDGELSGCLETAIGRRQAAPQKRRQA